MSVSPSGKRALSPAAVRAGRAWPRAQYRRRAVQPRSGELPPARRQARSLRV